jgi:DNA polymerase III epsilon subunit-like protein
VYLFFDCETVGLPRYYDVPATDLRNWPRAVQLAWLLADAAGQEINSHSTVIRPDGWTIPADVAEIHGITTELALETGVPIGPLLNYFAGELERAEFTVAHNHNFDACVVGAEFIRDGRPNPIPAKDHHCTMLAGTPVCKIPGRYSDWKWPKLTELHQHLFGQWVEGAHDAMVDVRACARCFFELRRLGIIGPPPTVRAAVQGGGTE